MAEVQALLKADEVMVVALVGSERSFVWAVTRERAEWAEIDASNDTLAEHVRILRDGLDPLAQQNAEGSPGSRAGIKGGFDLKRAHELYKLVLGPVARLLDGKRHLIVVPTGPLTSLPLQVLITRPPALAAPIPRRDELRNAAWLIKSHAMSVLPSVQSLSALRKLALGSSATDPFFGMGDPILQGSGPTEQNRGKRAGRQSEPLLPQRPRRRARGERACRRCPIRPTSCAPSARCWAPRPMPSTCARRPPRRG